jgi:hypothetical protein
MALPEEQNNGRILKDYVPTERVVQSSYSTPDPAYPSPTLNVTPFSPAKEPAQTYPRDGNKSKNDKPWKPYAFALEKHPESTGKCRVYHGRLISHVNPMNFNVEGGGSSSGGSGGIARYIDQTGLFKPGVTSPDQFIGETGSQFKTVDLDWSGNVYLYWETDSIGYITKCELKGPEEPPFIPLPLADGNTVGKFWIKIGNVPAGDGEISQEVSSDVYWYGAFIRTENGSDSSSAGSDSSDSQSDSSVSSGSDQSASSDSGSDKSTAIVPMPWHTKGYGALFTMESNEVLFDFVMRDIKITGKETYVKIDSRFLYVCEPNSIAVTGAPCGPEPYPVGASIEGNVLKLSAYARKDRRPSKVSLKLTGIRRGFAGYDMPERSRAQFDANEKFLNSAYPAE